MAATRRKTTIAKTSATARRRRGTATVNRQNKKSVGRFNNFVVPLVFSLGILFCLGFLGLMGYRTVTASTFFDVKNVDVRGVSRISKDDIQKIVAAQTEKSGVWNADLNEIKSRIEKFSYVKSVAVSRILPDGIRVTVNERVPKAVAHLDTGDVWVDDEAAILGAVGKNDDKPPFVMRGWDISKTDEATKNNVARVKMYQKMINDWSDFDLSKRVKEVNMEDLDDLKAVVEDSGQSVSLLFGKDYSAKRLQKGLETAAGHGKEVSAINLRDGKALYIFRNAGN